MKKLNDEPKVRVQVNLPLQTVLKLKAFIHLGMFDGSMTKLINYILMTWLDANHELFKESIRTLKRQKEIYDLREIIDPGLAGFLKNLERKE